MSFINIETIILRRTFQVEWSRGLFFLKIGQFELCWADDLGLTFSLDHY